MLSRGGAPAFQWNVSTTRSRWFAPLFVVSIALNVAAVDNAVPSDPSSTLTDEFARGSEIEVPRWQVNPSDGRTMESVTATPGLSSSDAEVLGAVEEADPPLLGPYDAVRQEVMAVIGYPWGRSPSGWSIELLPHEGGLRGVTKSGEQ